MIFVDPRLRTYVIDEVFEVKTILNWHLFAPWLPIINEKSLKIHFIFSLFFLSTSLRRKLTCFCLFSTGNFLAPSFFCIISRKKNCFSKLIIVFLLGLLDYSGTDIFLLKAVKVVQSEKYFFPLFICFLYLFSFSVKRLCHWKEKLSFFEITFVDYF